MGYIVAILPTIAFVVQQCLVIDLMYIQLSYEQKYEIEQCILLHLMKIEDS